MGNKDCILCPALLLQSFGRFKSVQARHIDVEHHHTGLKCMGKLDRRVATEYHTHIYAKDGQKGAQCLCPVAVVIYY